MEHVRTLNCRDSTSNKTKSQLVSDSMLGLCSFAVPLLPRSVVIWPGGNNVAVETMLREQALWTSLLKTQQHYFHLAKLRPNAVRVNKKIRPTCLKIAAQCLWRNLRHVLSFWFSSTASLLRISKEATAHVYVWTTTANHKGTTT